MTIPKKFSFLQCVVQLEYASARAEQAPVGDKGVL